MIAVLTYHVAGARLAGGAIMMTGIGTDAVMPHPADRGQLVVGQLAARRRVR